jgi:hypothetical protein
MLALLPVTSSVAQAQGVVNRGFSVPVTGTASPEGVADGPVQAVSGTFTIQRFARSGDEIVAVGTLVGTVASAVPGEPARTFVTRVAVPLVRPDNSSSAPSAAPSDITILATCDILNLVLGPLDLNLLGLRVQLNQVVLDITAVTGAGNLLGNLLCAITNLLNGGGPLGQVIGLLNSLLAILG